MIYHAVFFTSHFYNTIATNGSRGICLGDNSFKRNPPCPIDDLQGLPAYLPASSFRKLVVSFPFPEYDDTDSLLHYLNERLGGLSTNRRLLSYIMELEIGAHYDDVR